jgi:hypothetical protein
LGAEELWGRNQKREGHDFSRAITPKKETRAQSRRIPNGRLQEDFMGERESSQRASSITVSM